MRSLMFHRKISLFIVLSLALHLLVFKDFVASSFSSPPEKSPPPLEFEVLAPPTEPPAQAKGTQVPSRSSRGRQGKASSVVQNLMTGLSASSFSMGPQTPIENSRRMNLHVDFSDPETYRDAGAGGYEEYGYFHEEVYRQIDSHLLYDSLLAQYRHRGWVYFKFDLNQQGQLIDGTLQASSDDPILKVHSARVIRAGLSQKLNENKQVHKFERSTFFVRFYYGHEGQERACAPSAHGLILTLCRFASEKAVSTNLVDHVLTGGLSADPFVAVERWEQYRAARRRKMGDVDPFWSYRRDPDYNL